MLGNDDIDLNAAQARLGDGELQALIRAKNKAKSRSGCGGGQGSAPRPESIPQLIDVGIGARSEAAGENRSGGFQAPATSTDRPASRRW